MKRTRSSKLKDFARGQPCTLRLPCCNADPETTVCCHLPGGIRGMGLKTDDWHSIHACSACHDALDGRSTMVGMNRTEVLAQCIQAMYRTTQARIDAGLITIR